MKRDRKEGMEREEEMGVWESVGSRARQESKGQRVTWESVARGDCVARVERRASRAWWDREEGMEHQEEMGVRESVGSRARLESKDQRVTRDRKDLQELQEEMG